jgi:AMP nucleosidase
MKKKQDEVFSNHTETHLNMGLDAVKSLNAYWDKVERRLACEW